MVDYDYDTYNEIMNKELSIMIKLLDDLDNDIERRKVENNGSDSNTSC